jgi:hypothetical protein
MEQSIEYDWEYIEINELNVDITTTDNKILQEEELQKSQEEEQQKRQEELQKRQEEKELIEKAELDLIEDLFTNNNKRMEVKLPVNYEEKEEVIIKSKKSRKQTSKTKNK